MNSITVCQLHKIFVYISHLNNVSIRQVRWCSIIYRQQRRLCSIVYGDDFNDCTVNIDSVIRTEIIQLGIAQ